MNFTAAPQSAPTSLFDLGPALRAQVENSPDGPFARFAYLVVDAIVAAHIALGRPITSAALRQSVEAKGTNLLALFEEGAPIRPALSLIAAHNDAHYAQMLSPVLDRLFPNPARGGEGENGQRQHRQERVHEWCVAAFGLDQASSVPQRGLRLAEEAIEAAQASGVDAGMLHRLIDYIYAKPPGELGQELGGVGVTLLALAAAAQRTAEHEEKREVERIMSLPLSHFAARNATKNAAGFDVSAANTDPSNTKA